MEIPISLENIRDVLWYDPDYGEFKWRGKKKFKCREEVGSDRQGYIDIIYGGVKYKAHILAWMYYYNEVPVGEIDHIDRNRANNAIWNLRPATRSQNMANRPPQSNNKSGYKGVYWWNHGSRWVAKITVRGKIIHLGYFSDPVVAAKAYDQAAAEKFGSFAWLNFI